MLTGLLTAVYAAGAAWQDLRKDKIYNVYVLAGLFSGMVLQAATGGIKSVLMQGAYVVLALCILIPVYLIGGLGAGDVKFLAGVAAYVPLKEWFLVTGGAFVITAVYGVCKLLVKRTLHGTVHFAVPVFCSILILQGVRYI